jgi:hypothetical protein
MISAMVPFSIYERSLPSVANSNGRTCAWQWNPQGQVSSAKFQRQETKWV